MQLATVIEKKLKTSKIKVLQNNLINVVYFDVQISNPMSIYVGRDRKPLIIRKNNFPDYQRFLELN